VGSVALAMSRGTHVVILAAGRGSRMGALGAETPKWLLGVGSGTIAEHQLEAIEIARRTAPGAIASVRIVVGHAAMAIERFLGSRAHGVRVVHNAHYARLNNWYSVLLALQSIESDGSGVAILNADLVAAPDWIGRFLVDSGSTPAESLIAVDLQRRLTDESMKVSASDGQGGATLSRIGKVGVDDPVGEYVGMLMARGAVLESFRQTLDGFVDQPAAADEWYESAVGRTAASGVPWTVWPTPDSRWIEIDDDVDYEAALALMECD
jgi:choline kinase